VENGPVILQTAGEHASFVSDLAASLGEAASAYVLSSPTEAPSVIGDVPYSVVPVCLNGLSGHRKMFNVLITSGPSGARTLLNVCKDPHGHLLTAGPRPSGPELTFSGRLSYGLVSVSSIADQRDAIRWRRGLELLRIQLNTERITPESVMLASNAHGVGCFARWRNVNGGPCPLCNGRCAHVDLRLMRVAGLMARWVTAVPNAAARHLHPVLSFLTRFSRRGLGVQPPAASNARPVHRQSSARCMHPCSVSLPPPRTS
jgi:hypothetical protein